MIKYKLIAATDVNTFGQLMTEALNNGWRMHGKLIVTPHHDATGYGMQYTQAAVSKCADKCDKPEPLEAKRALCSGKVITS